MAGPSFRDPRSSLTAIHFAESLDPGASRDYILLHQWDANGVSINPAGSAALTYRNPVTGVLNFNVHQPFSAVEIRNHSTVATDLLRVSVELDTSNSVNTAGVGAGIINVRGGQAVMIEGNIQRLRFRNVIGAPYEVSYSLYAIS